MAHYRSAGSLIALAVVAICIQTANFTAQNSQDPLRSAMARRIDGAKHGTGAVVGLLTPQSRSFVTYGGISLGGPAPTADTVFELGSITKVFTAFLLADMVERREVSLNDPVKKFLPASVKVPSRGGKEILLVDLATHTAGLPRDSVEVDLNRDDSAYTGYTANDLYAFLGSHKLARNPGTQPADYSNVGYGLLGHALELRAGISYEELLRQRLLEPLGMTSTSITVNADQKSRLAIGHNSRQLPIPPWAGGIIESTGAAKSTASDMLKFGAAVLDPRSPMRAVFARMTSVQRKTEESRNQQALGWGMFKLGSNAIVAHSGGTLGFESRLLVDTTRKRVVIAWANGRSGDGVSNLVGLALDRERLE